MISITMMTAQRRASCSGAVALILSASMVTGCGGTDESNDSASIGAMKSNLEQGDQVGRELETDGTEGDQAVADQHAHTNRLAHETSPYLLQHAHNPVDWYPWGDEAFEAARAQNKPIFLSVGYSTCYWCHVMERESFEDEAIARLMNEVCICIKVDREERPDVDDIYMTAIQLISGQGGWPMSVFIDPASLKPFFGGTYFPAEPGLGRISFPELLSRVQQVWSENQDGVVADAERLGDQIALSMQRPLDPVSLSREHIDLARANLMAAYDEEHGGFGGGPQLAPKFPTPVNLEFLLATSWDRPEVQKAIRFTLDRMATGGMYDQIGGGFHRYSTDRTWTVPHFEKMLYDNGQLATTYARVYELTDDAYYAEITREILDYVLKEMKDANGAFHSAQDAEVNAREGQNYLWSLEQMSDALAAAGLREDVPFALDVYGIHAGTNFQDPHHPNEPRSNVVLLRARPETLALELKMTLDDFNASIDRVNSALYDARQKRDQPGLDDKILTAWNGLMIEGCAEGGRVLGEQKYLDAAADAANAILQHMSSPDGGLLRTSRGGTSRIPAFAEDYASFMRGLIALHHATKDQRWLDEAVRLTDIMNDRFGDAVNGGWFDTLEGQSDLFVRGKSAYDGAIPCAVSMMLGNLGWLHAWTGDDRYRDQLMAGLRSVSPILSARPTALTGSAAALAIVMDGLQVDALDFGAAPSGVAPSGIAPSVVTVGPVSASLALQDSGDETDAGAPNDAICMLTLSIDSPFHVNAPEPGDPSLIPLALELERPDSGTLTIDWPEADVYAGPVGAMRVYSGDVRIPIRIRWHGTDRSRLVLTWQACDDRACLRPETHLLELPSEN